MRERERWRKGEKRETGVEENKDLIRNTYCKSSKIKNKLVLLW